MVTNLNEAQLKIVNDAENRQAAQTKYWMPVVGIALLYGGFYFFNELTAMENGDTTVSIPRKFKFIYNFGGKWLFAAIFWIMGIALIFNGIKNIIIKK